MNENFTINCDNHKVLKNNISFRFLHVITNMITDDHVTVGVLQWDGKILRFASDNQKLSIHHERVLTAIRAQISTHKPNGIDVREAFPVPEGVGSMLLWGKVHHSFTTNPERHFCDLVRLSEIDDKKYLEIT
jgi:hypothetical protein